MSNHPEKLSPEILASWRDEVFKTLATIGAKRTPLITDIVGRGLTLSSEERENRRLLHPGEQDGISIGTLPTGDTKFWTYPDKTSVFGTKYKGDIELEIRSKVPNRLYIPGMPIVTPQETGSIACLELYLFNESLWDRVLIEQPLVESEQVWERIRTSADGHEPITLHLTQAMGLDGKSLVRADLYKHVMQGGEYITVGGISGPKKLSHESALWTNGVLTNEEVRESDTGWYMDGAFGNGRWPAKAPYVIQPRQ
jgi:hypothetical protein